MSNPCVYIYIYGQWSSKFINDSGSLLENRKYVGCTALSHGVPASPIDESSSPINYFQNFQNKDHTKYFYIRSSSESWSWMLEFAMAGDTINNHPRPTQDAFIWK